MNISSQQIITNNMSRNYILHSNFPHQNSRNRLNSYVPRQQMYSRENGNFWCETCDRGFATINLLEQHNQQHQKCNIDGCQFIAHPKVVTKHIQIQHSTGLYKKIAKLDNPEEIKKWREERKKNFPTKSNIEKRAAELNEKIKRGEKMGLPYNRNRRHNKNNTNIQPGKKRKYESKNYKNQHCNRDQNTTTFLQPVKTDNINHTPRKKNPKIIILLEQKKKLKPFAGIQNIVIEDQNVQEIELPNTGMLIEDDDDDICKSGACIEEESLDIEEPSMCNALTSLLCNYGSSDEDNVNPLVVDKDTTNNLKLSLAIQNNMPTINERNFNITNNENNITKRNEECQNKILFDNSTNVNEATMDDDSGPEEIAVVKVNKIQINDSPDQNKTDCRNIPKKRKDDTKFRHKNTNNYRPKPKLPSTLLQKLLFKEIRQERNIILQCVKYITTNNYFDKKIE